MRYITLIGVEKISAIEGQNEGDHEWFQGQRAAQGNWSKAVVEYQKSVYEALRRRYAKDVLPVVSPTVLDWKPQDMALLRDAAGFCDIVAIHSYVQNAQEPETDEPYASLSWYLQEVRDPFKPGAPVMVTETGYNDLQGPGRKGVSEKAAAIYLPRLLLNNFAAGIKRTFLYEFLDEGANPNEWENHWGLVRYDNAPKPSFEAITALIASLKNDGGTPAGDSAPLLSLETSVQDLSNLRMMAFRRPDGSLVTAIWRALPCWTLEEHADVDVSTIPVKLTFEKPIARASLVTLDKPVERRELKAEGAELVLPVGASVALMTTA
jgi:hypothetical protein